MKLTFRQKLHVAGYALAVGVAGISTCGEIRGCQHREAALEAHEARVEQAYERLKPCPDRNDALRGCYEQKARTAMLEQAEEDKGAGKLREAGVAFAKLGMETEALEMAGRCALRNDGKGEAEIREWVTVMKEAMQRYSGEGLGGSGDRVDLGDAGHDVPETRDVSEPEADAGTTEDAGAQDVAPEADESSEEELGEDAESEDAAPESEPEVVDAEPESDDAADAAEDAGTRRGRDAGRRRRDAGRVADSQGNIDTTNTPDADVARDAGAARETSGTRDAGVARETATSDVGVADAPARETRGRPISW